MMSGAVVRLVVMDDHAVVRDGIRLLCEQTADMQLVGEARTVEEILQVLERTQPDAALLDVNVPDGSGLDVVRAAAERWPQVRTILLTVERDEDVVLEAVEAGAAGYVTKETSLPDLFAAVRRVVAGETVVEGMQPGQLLRRFVEHAREAEHVARVLGELSPREGEVLAVLAQGRTNGQIASQLGIASRTATSHVSSIYRKLGVTNRVDAAKEAIRLGLVSAWVDRATQPMARSPHAPAVEGLPENPRIGRFAGIPVEPTVNA
jgi:DNA-binding NarL/FixJ family response regulator